MAKIVPVAYDDSSEQSQTIPFAISCGFPIWFNSPTFKISMREYEDMSIKVGDKVTIEIKKTESSGI